MKNTIVINPVDEDMELLLESISILNAYKTEGFVRREAFVELVMGEDTSYHNLQGMQKLNNFWACRVKDKALNDDLTRILEKLKVN